VPAGRCFNETAILAADVDLGAIARGTFDFDVAGHYACPDIFRLYVIRGPQQAGVFERYGT
jgi:nitrilase